MILKQNVSHGVLENKHLKHSFHTLITLFNLSGLQISQLTFECILKTIKLKILSHSLQNQNITFSHNIEVVCLIDSFFRLS